MLLEGRSILVTGAGSGIGRALALTLGQRGARLILVGRRKAPLEETAALLPQGGRGVVVPADITAADGRHAVVRACSHGGLDIAINNAGMILSGAFADLDDTDLQRMVAVNVTAPIALTRDLLPTLRLSDRPRVVNIGSVFGDIGHPYFAAYCATKFALRGLSDALRRELDADGIGITYAAPRATRTDAAERFEALVEPFGMAVDDPMRVAAAIVAAIEHEAPTAYARGAERLFVLLQRWAPMLIDVALKAKTRSVRRQLSAVTPRTHTGD